MLGKTDLSIILYSSPLPPSATLKRLEQSFELVNCSEVLEIAKQDELQGNRFGLKNFVENKLAELRVQVENTEVLLQQLSELMLVFTVSLPLIIAGLLFTLSPGQGVSMLVVFSAIGALVGMLGFVKIPEQLRFPMPDGRVYFPLVLLVLPFVFDFIFKIGNLSFPLSALLAAPSAFLTYREEVLILEELRENEEMLVNAVKCPFHLYRCVRPEKVEEPVRVRLSRTVRTLLRLYGGFGVEPQGLRWLLEYYKQHFKLIRDIRSRTLIALLNGIVGVSVLAVGLALIDSVFSGLPSVSVAGLNVSPESFTQIKPVMNLVLAINSLSYSISTASVREGNPLYFPLYLPFMFLTTFAGLTLAPLLIPPLG